METYENINSMLGKLAVAKQSNNRNLNSVNNNSGNPMNNNINNNSGNPISSMNNGNINPSSLFSLLFKKSI